MADPDYPLLEETVQSLRLMGWSCKVSGFTTSTGRIFYQVEGSKEGQRIRVQGRIAREAWHKAVQAAVAFGPSPG